MSWKIFLFSVLVLVAGGWFYADPSLSGFASKTPDTGQKVCSRCPLRNFRLWWNKTSGCFRGGVREGEPRRSEEAPAVKRKENPTGLKSAVPKTTGAGRVHKTHEEKKYVIPQITVTQLKKKMDAGEDFLLLDVREQKEYDIARIPGSKLLPLSVLPQKWEEELGDYKDKEIVIHCKKGGRSQQACEFLAAKGFENVINVTGGITAWSEQVDPSVPKY